MKTSKKIVLGIVIGVVGFFAIGLTWAGLWRTYYPEEAALFDKERERERLAEQQRLELAEFEKEKEIANFKEVYSEDGLLKYRPYWLVGDGYKELEFKGDITRDSTCASLARAANEENIIDSFYLDLWLGGCVKNPGNEYKDILWNGTYLKYRLYWKRADVHKNIDNRPAEFKKLHQELNTNKIQNKFDPNVVKSAKENIPKMQELPRTILEQCKRVRSYSDYQVFTLAIKITEDDLLSTLKSMDSIITILELSGYDNHPEVGPLIRQTRSLAIETSDCLTDLTRRYG